MDSHVGMLKFLSWLTRNVSFKAFRVRQRSLAASIVVPPRGTNGNKRGQTGSLSE
jgi:hypothetical protein